MYRIILLICAVVLCGTTVMTILTDQPWQLDALQLSGAVIMLISLWLNIRFRIMDQAAVVILLLVHVALLPQMFLYGEAWKVQRPCGSYWHMWLPAFCFAEKCG